MLGVLVPIRVEGSWSDADAKIDRTEIIDDAVKELIEKEKSPE